MRCGEYLVDPGVYTLSPFDDLVHWDYPCQSGAIVFSTFMSEKDFKLRIAMATHTESTRAHRWIIGYGTSASIYNWHWQCQRQQPIASWKQNH